MEKPTLHFPPNYVTLKQLQDRRLKLQQEAAKRHWLKQEEERLHHRPPPAEPKKFYHSKERTTVQKPAAASEPVIVEAAAGNPGDARHRGRSRAAAPGSSLLADALREKGKEAAIAPNPSPKNAGGERDGDVTVHGGNERPVEGAGRGRGRGWAGGRERGRNSRIEGLGGFQWRAVAGSVTGARSEEGLKVSDGDERQAERNGVVAGRGPMAGRERWRAINGSLPVVDQVVKVIGGNAVVERGSSSLAGRGYRKVTSGSLPMDDEAVKVIEELKVGGGSDTQVERNAMVAGRGRSSTTGRGHPRVSAGSLPVVRVDEDSKVIGENVMAAETGSVAAASELDQVVVLAVAGDNVIRQEGKAVMRKERGSMAGRWRGGNNRFQGHGRFSWRAVAGSRPVDGLLWAKKATV